MPEEHERIILTENVPDERLVRGDVGTVVHVYDGSKAFEVEFVALDGKTLAVVTLDATAVRRVRPRELPHARATTAA